MGINMTNKDPRQRETATFSAAAFGYHIPVAAELRTVPGAGGTTVIWLLAFVVPWTFSNHRLESTFRTT
jgi:hypothetical protein